MLGLSTADGFMSVKEGVDDMIKYLANEPSVGLYFVQQHAQSSMPYLLDVKDKVMEKIHEVTLHTEDVEEAIDVVRSMTEIGYPLSEEMIKDIKTSLLIISKCQPKRGIKVLLYPPNVAVGRALSLLIIYFFNVWWLNPFGNCSQLLITFTAETTTTFLLCLMLGMSFITVLEEIPHYQKKQAIISTIIWKAPHINWIKCNTDAAYKPSLHKAATILRNHHGCFLHSQSSYTSTHFAIHAEFLAFELGVNVCLQLNLNNIWLECDSLLVINILSHDKPFPAHCLQVIRSIQSKLMQIDHMISFIHREGNRIAHWIAQSQLQGHIEYHMLPSKIKGQIILEAIETPHIRKK